MSTNKHHDAAAPVSRSLSLSTVSTFDSPPSPKTDCIYMPSLPNHSLTSTQALEKQVQMSSCAVDDIISKVAYSSSSLLDIDQGFTPPTYLQGNNNSFALSTSSPPSYTKFHEDHFCDSGLGSSLASSPSEETTFNFSKSALLPTSILPREPKAELFDTIHPSGLSQHTVRQVKRYIIRPILQENDLQEFHNLVKQLPLRIAEGKVQSLRELEKALIFLASAASGTAESYLRFCEFSIQCLHTTVDHVNPAEQRKPTDRPYNNLYFVDLLEQVRQYARIMAITRKKKVKGELLVDEDYKEGENLKLIPGNATEPAELVREYRGKKTPIDVGRRSTPLTSPEVDDNFRSMARKRKCDMLKVEYLPCRKCDKIFNRPCDRSKHEKTHTRPWKCPEPDCRYHVDGWPTEKECERHVNDKHMTEAKMYKCIFEPCPYTSKRESNCKQHMEKAHGWQYDRCRTKKGDKVNTIKVTVQSVKGSKTPPSTATTPVDERRGSYVSPAPSDNSRESGTAQLSVRSSPHEAPMQYDQINLTKMLASTNSNDHNLQRYDDAGFADIGTTPRNLTPVDYLPTTNPEINPQSVFAQNAYNNFVDHFQVYQPQTIPTWESQQYNYYDQTLQQDGVFDPTGVPNPDDPGFEQWLRGTPQQYPPEIVSPVEDFALYDDEETVVGPVLAGNDTMMLDDIRADVESPSHGLRLGIEEDPVLGQWMNLDDVEMDLF